MLMSQSIDNNTIEFNRLEVDYKTGKMQMKYAVKELNEDEINVLKERHRLVLKAHVPTSDSEDNVAVIYAPISWEIEQIENYVQVLMDELFLIRSNSKYAKSMEEITEAFKLEILTF